MSIAFLVQIRVVAGSLVGSTFYGIQSNVYLVGLMFSLNGRVSYAAGEVHGDTSDERVGAPSYCADSRTPRLPRRHGRRVRPAPARRNPARPSRMAPIASSASSDTRRPP